MILDQLTLRNFCLYHGKQVFDLKPVHRNGSYSPIVLIGGINGGGKTTLLDAVQLVLYGNRAKCSKRTEMPYDEFLLESIHRSVDPKDGASIDLKFRYAAEGKEHLYEVTRSWSTVGRRVREQVQICKDGNTDDWLSDNWNQCVEELIPLGIAQLCFFDAEKIRFLAEDETDTLALGGAIKSLLGLDLAEKLVADAEVLETRVAKRTRKTFELEEVKQLEQSLTTQQFEIDRLVQEIGGLENRRQAAIDRLRDAEETFANAGGHHWEQRTANQRRLNELEHAIQERIDDTISLAATELPLALVLDLLGDVASQDTQERLAKENEIIEKRLSKRDKELLEFLEQKNVDSSIIGGTKEFLLANRAEIAGHVEVERRLSISDNGKRSLDHLLDRGLADRCRSANELINKLDQRRRDLEDVQRRLSATPQDDAVREVANELKAASSEIASFDLQIKSLDKQLASSRTVRETIHSQIQKLRRKVIEDELSAEEDSRFAGLIVRTQQTMKTYIQNATTRKIDRLSELITESFRYLLRKKTLVQRVLIDPETFTITLRDSEGHSIPKQRLSEGEKQIFGVSVLWGLSQASSRPLPVIIDTPMARLDIKHREHLVDRYFPHASHQVIVLSTDTEVDRRYFKDLQKHVARAYHLNYDELAKATQVEPGYFWTVPSAIEVEEVST